MKATNELIKEVQKSLERIKVLYIKTSGLFNLIIKHHGEVIFVKIIKNIDSLTENTAKNLSNISYIFNARLIVVGKYTRLGALKNFIIYKRFGISCMTPKSLEHLLQGEVPIIECLRGGQFIYIDPIKLRYARIKKGLTQKKLAEMVNVNKKFIYEHEKNLKKAKRETVDMMMKILNYPIIFAPNIKISMPQKINPKSEFERNVFNYFYKMGFDTKFIYHTAFNMVAKDEDIFLMYVKEFPNKDRIEILKSISAFLKNPAMVISKTEKTYDLPSIYVDELKEMSKKKIKKLACLK